jgi:hypothetical protein
MVMDAFPQKQVDFRMLEEVSGIMEGLEARLSGLSEEVVRGGPKILWGDRQIYASRAAFSRSPVGVLRLLRDCIICRRDHGDVV